MCADGMRLVAFIVTLLTACNGHTMELTSHASVAIADSLGIARVSEIDFGRISNASGTCTMASDGRLTGSNGNSCAGHRSPAEFVVSGPSGRSIAVSATGSPRLDGVLFTPVIVGSISKQLLNGSATINIIGALTLSAAIVADRAVRYTLTTNYQ